MAIAAAVEADRRQGIESPGWMTAIANLVSHTAPAGVAERYRANDDARPKTDQVEGSVAAPASEAGDPEHGVGNQRAVLEKVGWDLARAEEIYERAVAADPSHATNLGNYAVFLEKVYGNHNRARALFERALAADPSNATNLGNYAAFLEYVGGDHDLAQQMFERAITVDPHQANNLSRYALFLKNVRQDDDRAQEISDRALAVDPRRANNGGDLGHGVVGYARGAWDMFHVGHLNLLRTAREQCDYLVVGVVPDEDLLRIRGKRPVVPFEERMQILGSLLVVDEVVRDAYPNAVEAWRQLPFNLLFTSDSIKDSPEGLRLTQDLATVDVEVRYLPFTRATSSADSWSSRVGLR